MSIRVSGYVATLLAASCASHSDSLRAQNYDILERSPQTTIYLETEYSGNEVLEHCDWYIAADDFVTSLSTVEYGAGCRISLRILGIINREGAALFSRVVDRATALGFRVTSLVLDSRGGDADAAISMARLIRQSEIFSASLVIAKIAEDHQSVCLSACVVLFSAADDQELEFNINGDPDLPSRIGIHGPGQFDRTRGAYYASANNSEIARVSRRLKDYFRSIEIAERLVDDMFAIPFDQIHLLNREELIAYGLYTD
ncbi:MAG: hypothetical protein P8M18_10060 [Woeseiaceae bacterium]|nr:hypothetical protein [Woeseiaceae bacterium]